MEPILSSGAGDLAKTPSWAEARADLTLPPIWGYSDRTPLLLDSCDGQGPAHWSHPPQPPMGLPRSTPTPTVVTFYPHPQEFFSGTPRPWLTPLDEKATLLRALGVQQLVLLPFNPELATLSPEAFVEKILIHCLQARHISVGADFRFGHRREGTAARLKTLAAPHGVTVTVVDLAQAGGDRISSSRIREALWTGDLAMARQLLGRPYAISGRVVQGQQLGRQLGFPTANLRVPMEKCLPRTGVYGVQVYGIPGSSPQCPLTGVMNLGVRPTVAGQTQTLEVHVLDWAGDLYGQTLTVTLEAFLRPEQRFDSLDQLKAQIQTDCQRARALLRVGNRPEVRA